MSVIKIQGGTRSDGKSLCNTCQHAQVMKGAAESSEMVHCSYISERIRHSVVSCNHYYRDGQPTINDLYHTAWILETSKKDKQYGFVPYKEWRENHKGEKVTPNVYD